MSEFEENLKYGKEHCADCERLRKVESRELCKYHRKKNVTKITSDTLRGLNIGVNGETTDPTYSKQTKGDTSKIASVEKPTETSDYGSGEFKMFSQLNTRWQNVNQAINFCNLILFNGDERLHEFLDKIEAKKSFDMTTVEASHICDAILDFRVKGYTMKVNIYKAKNPWSKVYGYYTPSKPFEININSRKLAGRSTKSVVATLVHELIHAIDGLDLVNSFGHGSNSSVNKDDTAPYWIGTLASTMYTDDGVKDEYPRYKRKKRCFFI